MMTDMNPNKILLDANEKKKKIQQSSDFNQDISFIFVLFTEALILNSIYVGLVRFNTLPIFHNQVGFL